MDLEHVLGQIQPDHADFAIDASLQQWNRIPPRHIRAVGGGYSFNALGPADCRT